MRISIVALGSRGDVQPYVALGLGLQAVGHQVCIVTHEHFKRLICDHGLDFALVRANPKALLEEGAALEMVEGGHHPVRAFLNLAEATKSVLINTGIDCLSACQQTDLILYSAMGFYVIPHIAEKLKLPTICACLQPLHKTGEFPGLTSPTTSDLGSFLNRLTWRMDEALLWWPYRAAVNQFREDYLNLPPIPARLNYKHHWRDDLHTIYGFSSCLVPHPADWKQYPQVEITGYWFHDQSSDQQLPAGLIDFLDAGSPPVYVGFGSMSNRRAEETTEIIFSALERSNQRGVLVTGWGGLNQSDAPETIFIADNIPHEWLFPQMAAVVHHGGAGTTAAGIRAGVPSIIVPFFSDQPFWGQRIADLEVGPAPIPRKQLTVERLAAAVEQTVNDHEMQHRAAELGECIRSEDGVSQAVAAIETMLTQAPLYSAVS